MRLGCQISHPAYTHTKVCADCKTPYLAYYYTYKLFMKKHLFLSALLYLLLLSFGAKAQIITTIAGGTWMPYGGDGGPATAAFMAEPCGIAIDAAGNIFVADMYNCRVRKVSPAGTISTFAGNGIPSYSGDGGPATAAGIMSPNSLAIDAAGNVYVSDGDNRIRKIDGSGMITTVAGDGTPAYGGDGGPATAANLNAPAGLAFDASGNLYIADMDNHCIRKVSPAGNISTIAGIGGLSGSSGDGGPATTAGLNYPAGVAADAAMNIYIADRDNNRIRMVDPSGNISTVAGNGMSGGTGDGGPATSAMLSGPVNVCIRSGNIYIADESNDRIRKIDASYTISTVVGLGSGYGGDGGLATGAQLSHPAAVAFNAAGDMYIADCDNSRIRKVNTAGIISTAIGTIYLGDGGPATAASVYGMNDICTDPSGNIYITDAGNSLIRKIDPSGTITTFAGSLSPGFSGDGGPAAAAKLHYPVGIASDAAGNIYFGDAINSRVRKVNTAGIITTVAGGGTGYYSGDGGPATNAGIATTFIAVDGAGNLYLSETTISQPRIRKVDAAGIITTFAGTGTSGYTGDGGPATDAQFGSVESVVADAAGNVYVADVGNKVVRKINTAGIITTFAGNGSTGYTGDGGPATAAGLGYSRYINVDNTGNVQISDMVHHVIRSVDAATGIISTIAGSGVEGYAGDGGPATVAELAWPGAVTTDATGNVYIADGGNGALRKISAPLPPVSNVGVTNTAVNNATVLMPNPVHNTLVLSAPYAITSVVIIDALGRVAHTQTYSSKTVTISTTHLESGLYTVVINGREARKVVKE
jgi:sugar lactone lactonase YvrE